jgi:hypothetical protein
LDRLPSDRATESAVREVLGLFLTRRGSALYIRDVAHRVERPESAVSAILDELAKAFVLDVHGDSYSYSGDPFSDVEIDRFLKRADSHSNLVQSNVAKFRQRYGYR